MSRIVTLMIIAMTFANVGPADAAKKAKKPSTPAAATSFMAGLYTSQQPGAVQAEAPVGLSVAPQQAGPAASGQSLVADSSILLKDSDPKSTVMLSQATQDTTQTATDAAGLPAAAAVASVGEVGAVDGANATMEAGGAYGSEEEQKDEKEKKNKKKKKHKHSKSKEEDQAQMAETKFLNNVLILMIAVAAMGGTVVLYMHIKKNAQEGKRKETVVVNDAKLAKIKQKAADLAGRILNKNPNATLPR